MASFRQPSFAAGELTPLLHGRHDLAKYAVGLKRARNFFIGRQGAAVSRPGTKYIAEVKTSSDGAVRLVPFVFSDNQALVLEFGHNYIRFYTNGGQVMSGMSPYEVTTTYATADLPRLKFAQAGDVITITHQSYPPKELTRTSNTSWALTTISFSVPEHTLGGAGTLYSASYAYPQVAAAWASGTTYGSGDIVTQGGKTWVSTSASNKANPPQPIAYNAGTTYWADAIVTDNTTLWRSLVAGNLANTPHTSSSYWAPADFTGNPWWTEDESLEGRLWQYAVTVLVQNIAGTIQETAGLVENSGSQFLVGPYSSVSITTSTGALAVANPVWAFKIYRGLDGVFGLIGIQMAAGVFVDTGDEPDYTQAPPQGANPFVSATPGGVTLAFRRRNPPPSSTDYPACVALFEQRRCFANTVKRPAFILTSATNNYYNFDDVNIQLESSPTTWELASRELAQIRSLVPFQKLLAFTNSGVWAIGGANGSPLSFDSIDAKVQTELGASWLTPLVVDDSALFARSKGTGIRELTYDVRFQKFGVSDLSVLSDHLFVGHTITDWAYAEDPWGVVWAVREDGVLLSLTYLREHEVVAWAWHDTEDGAGVYEAVCSIPNGTADDVYFEVKRTINGTVKRYIEIQTNRVVTDDTDPTNLICLDCALTYDGSPATTISGLDHLEAKTVYALADGFVEGPFTVTGGEITLPAEASVVQVGLPYTPELEQLPLAVPGAEVRTKQKSVRRATVEVMSSRGFSVGPDFDNLVEWRQRQVSDAFSEIGLQTSTVLVDVPGTWESDASICIRQTNPLPVTVTAITREVEFGDD